MKLIDIANTTKNFTGETTSYTVEGGCNYDAYVIRTGATCVMIRRVDNDYFKFKGAGCPWMRIPITSEITDKQCLAYAIEQYKQASPEPLHDQATDAMLEAV
jgi:hypothetical protein